MHIALRIVIGLPGVLFVAIASRWIVDPAGAAAQLGMPLLHGAGLSTQIGDLTAFFLAGGAMMLLGVITLHRTWFYAAAMLVGGAAVFRIVAWDIHGAALATESIIFEVVVTALMLLGASKVPPTGMLPRAERV